ncbi:MAG: helix-turn-helix domain-containing protein [Treponema sp.]|nr:helix-turn-helix domain-containing protein [Treponema sp.]
MSEGTILDRIRAIRKTLGINQSEFAKRIGLTQTSMSMIEIGKSNLTDKNIKMICTTFNVQEKWLRNGSGEMFGSPSPYEKELVDILGQLTDDTQEFLLDMARNLLKRQEKSQALADAEEHPPL